MKEVINIYRKQKVNVDSFIKRLIDSLPEDYMTEAPKILKEYTYIQLMYGVNSEYKQITPIMYKNGSDSKQIGSSKSHYFLKLNLDENKIYISNPYIHYKTGKASISVVHFVDSTYYIFDINLVNLLEELRLIEYNGFHDRVKRVIYFFGSTALALVAIALIGYGVFVFFVLMSSLADSDFLHDIFKSIISITLGLAIYDLAKQIFEYEVMYQSFHKSEDKQYKVLGRFLISIIIALSIETLMVVFKIALEDLSNMASAFYLLIGTTIMLVGLAYFYKTIQEATPKEEDSI
ncbi:MAG: hypothetical protein WCY51_05955 [Sulfurimonas sp.]|uniref:hypothetical protein n=1 Tax=Sulfurimonas sp. TaxID=2022749 RepID=UPI0025DE18B6|nr:hypothetical protein [Sulfurimonas sp.]MCK9455384.1 hypothetical protein [Sulfurimonas sp.]